MVVEREGIQLAPQVLELAAESCSIQDIGDRVLPVFRRLFRIDRMLFYRSHEESAFSAISGDVECLPEYSERIAHRDPIQTFMKAHNPHYFAGSYCRAWQDLRAQPEVVDFYRRWELASFFHMRLSDSKHMEPGYVGIVCGRSARRKDFEEKDLRAAAAVLPALRAAVRRAGRVEFQLSGKAALEALWERRQDSATLALDLRGNLLWASARAEQFLGGARRPLPETFGEAARRLAQAVGKREWSASPPTFRLEWRTVQGRLLEGEVFMARNQAGDPFVVLDFGVCGVSPLLRDLSERYGLTRSETEVLADLVRGLSDSEIAADRFVSVATVRTHMTRLLGKMGAKSRLQAAALAMGTAAR